MKTLIMMALFFMSFRLFASGDAYGFSGTLSIKETDGGQSLNGELRDLVDVLNCRRQDAENFAKYHSPNTQRLLNKIKDLNWLFYARIKSGYRNIIFCPLKASLRTLRRNPKYKILLKDYSKHIKNFSNFGIRVKREGQKDLVFVDIREFKYRDELDSKKASSYKILHEVLHDFVGDEDHYGGLFSTLNTIYLYVNDKITAEEAQESFRLSNLEYPSPRLVLLVEDLKEKYLDIVEERTSNVRREYSAIQILKRIGHLGKTINKKEESLMIWDYDFAELIQLKETISQLHHALMLDNPNFIDQNYNTLIKVIPYIKLDIGDLNRNNFSLGPKFKTLPDAIAEVHSYMNMPAFNYGNSLIPLAVRHKKTNIARFLFARHDRSVSHGLSWIELWPSPELTSTFVDAYINGLGKEVLTNFHFKKEVYLKTLIEKMERHSKNYAEVFRDLGWKSFQRVQSNFHHLYKYVLPFTYMEDLDEIRELCRGTSFPYSFQSFTYTIYYKLDTNLFKNGEYESKIKPRLEACFQE